MREHPPERPVEHSPELYRDLYEDAPCGYLSVDARGIVTAVNRTLLEWIGRPRDAIRGSSFVGMLPAAAQLFYETRFAPVVQLQGEIRAVALEMVTMDGTLAVLINARMADDGAGGRETRMAVFDATERQNYERELLSAQRDAEASESRVRSLQAAASAFDESQSDAQLAELLMESARDAMAASACVVLLVDDSGATTHVAGVHPLAALAADPSVRSEIDALRRAGVVIIGSLDEARASYPGLVDGLIKARVKAFSVVPIKGHGEALGALMCFFSRARELSPEDVDLQVSIARQAAQALTRLRLQDDLLAMALHDHLTGVANRRLLREHLIQGMAAAGRRGRPMAMLVLDLDGFKSVNDERGHPEGDALLVWVAHQITASVRADDIVGRFGGDEFMVICQEADEAVALEVAERVRAAIAEHPDGLPDGASLSASVGIAICPPERSSMRPEDLFAVADAALYRSKREGKNRVNVDAL